jgi:hypothetical protein
MQAEKLLTIGVPTYNRSTILDQFLPQLIHDIGDLAFKVTIIISDNCSTDDTENVAKKWIASAQNIDIRYFKQVENIGVSRNVVSLIYHADTPYFMVLGDDDKINPLFFPKLVSILDSDARPSAIIQAIWPGKPTLAENKLVTFSAAQKYFYEYGNAWSAVIDMPAARNAIDSRGLRLAIEDIVWPQTAIGYLAMYDLSPRPVCLVASEMGNQLVPDLNIRNKAYWNRSLHDLLRAAVIIDDNTGNKGFKKSILTFCNSGFRNQVKAIAAAALYERGGAETTDIRKLLRAEYGLSGFFHAAAFWLIDQPKILFYLCNLLLLATKGPKRAMRFNQDIENRRRATQADIQNLGKNKKRFGDWF